MHAAGGAARPKTGIRGCMQSMTIYRITLFHSTARAQALRHGVFASQAVRVARATLASLETKHWREIEGLHAGCCEEAAPSKSDPTQPAHWVGKRD